MLNNEKIDVLDDKGYVKFIEAWGHGEDGNRDDHEVGIIEAARQSTQKSFVSWEPYEDYPRGDKGLLEYLYKNKHSTPFEFSGMVIEVQAPILVFREWHRHRTQCLTGDTKITLVSPRGSTYKRTIKEIFDLKYGGVIDNAPSLHKNGTSKAGTPVFRDARRKNEWRIRILPNCQQRTLRVLNESTGEFLTAKMKDVWESGVKEVFSIKAGSYEVTASAEHPFFTKRGWVKTKNLEIGDQIARMGKVAAQERLIPPSLRSGIGVWTTMMRTRLIKDKEKCYVCKHIFNKNELELDHVIPVKDDLKMALDETNLKPICIKCHRIKTSTEQCDLKEKTRRGIRWETVERLPISVGVEPTYDIEVEGEHHNYCANDLVVHNSYNEMSARYAPLPDLYYVPTLERCMMANQSTTNKQAQGSGILTEENAKLWLDKCINSYNVAEEAYQFGLNVGIQKEVARCPMPVGHYTKMRCSANLRNWLAFLTLRADEKAQWEIRMYAYAVESIMEQVFPHTMRLYDFY